MSKDFFKKLKGAEESWEKSKTAKPRNRMVEVDAGSYIVRLQSLELNGGKGKQSPYVQFNTVVVHAENDDDLGKMIRKRINVEERKGTSKKGEKYHITIGDCLDQVAVALQSFGVNTEELELDDLEQVSKDLAEDQPACKVKVSVSGDYTNVYLNDYVEDEDLPAIDDVRDEDESDSDPDDDEDDDESDDEEEEKKPAKKKPKSKSKPKSKAKSDEDEDEDEDEDGDDSDDADDSDDGDSDGDDDDDSDDEEEVDIEKGSVVIAKPEGTSGKPETYTVTAINAKNNTLTLKRKKDNKVFKDQAFDVIEGLAE